MHFVGGKVPTITMEVDNATVVDEVMYVRRSVV